MYVKKSPRNTKVIGTETGAVPWQILRPPQCDDRKGGTLQQEVAQSSQRRQRASFPVIDATSAAVVVPVDRRRRCSPHISPFPFPLPPSSNLIVDCVRKLPPPSTHTGLRQRRGRHPPPLPSPANGHRRCCDDEQERRHNHYPAVDVGGGVVQRRR